MKKIRILLITGLFLVFNTVGQNMSNSVKDSDLKIEKKDKKKKKKTKNKLSNIDLSHWSITTPALNERGKATTIEPPEILNYANDERLIPFMYNDSINGGLVFYAYPSDATTANTKYSRSELREQIVPGDNTINWSFAKGGVLKATLAMDETSKDNKGKYHRTIILQIHGRLTNEQRDLIGQKDNNAPPILKIYWDNGKVRVKSKLLKNLNASDTEILHEDAWDNDKGFNFEQEVGFKKFSIEIQVSQGKMVIILNGTEYKVYENIHLKRWGIFENYFKAGNYFQSRDIGSFSKFRFYELEVYH